MRSLAIALTLVQWSGDETNLLEKRKNSALGSASSLNLKAESVWAEVKVKGNAVARVKKSVAIASSLSISDFI